MLGWDMQTKQNNSEDELFEIVVVVEV
jgi:hypothetical protein